MITDHVTGGWNIRWMEGCMGEPVGMTFASHQQFTAEEEEKETMREREFRFPIKHLWRVHIFQVWSSLAVTITSLLGCTATL